MVRAFLGGGSNLGDKEAYFREAVASFSDLRSVSGSVSYTHPPSPRD